MYLLSVILPGWETKQNKCVNLISWITIVADVLDTAKVIFFILLEKFLWNSVAGGHLSSATLQRGRMQMYIYSICSSF